MINYDNISVQDATLMQEQMRLSLKFEVPDHQEIHTIAGADISYDKGSTLMFGAIVILSFPQLKLKSYSLATLHSNFPYIPGFLGFREVPTLLKAWDLIVDKPDVVVLDGQGILHPRRMGVASHFGVLTKNATIGCAKNSLYGFYEEPAVNKKSYSTVFEKTTPIGYAVRTKDNNKLVYISTGYGLSLESSLSTIIKCIGKYRIPEPTRIAHEIVNQFRLGNLNEGFSIVDQVPTLF